MITSDEHYDSDVFSENPLPAETGSVDEENKINLEIANEQFGTTCDICNIWIEWQKDSTIRKSKRGVSGTFWGAIVGTFLAGPFGFLAGLLGGGPLSIAAGGPLNPKTCEKCINEEIGLCKKCSNRMTRGTHYQNGICRSCEPRNHD